MNRIITKTIKNAFFQSILLLFFFGCATGGQHNGASVADQTATEETAVQAAEAGEQEDPLHIQAGDFVVADYSLRLESGELIVTTSRSVAEDASLPKADWYLENEAYAAEELVVGTDTTKQELAEAVIGMSAGQKKTVTLPPEKAFGSADPEQIIAYPLTKSLPRVVTLFAQQYVNQFNAFPEVGEEVNYFPYFKSKITNVSKTTVTMEAMAVDGDIVDSEFGAVTISLEDDAIHTRLNPKVGAAFVLEDQQGVITEIGADTFTVDYNHPALGKTLFMDVEIVSFTKASTFQKNELEWIEDHDAGLLLAGNSNKPMVLVLYAGWCSWSKRFLNETIKDPRVQKHWQDFVWVKVDSDENKEYKEYYEQEGFPMIVLIDPDGEVNEKIPGYKDGKSFSDELENCLDSETEATS